MAPPMTEHPTEHLADKDAIRELLARYCFHLDNDRFEAMAGLFVADGVWETAFGTGTGHAGIAAQARGLATGPRPRRVHLTTNIVITLTGNTATAQSNWMLFQNTPSGPAIGSGGAYDDRLVKRDGQWLFQHRRIDRFIAEGRN
ncbi:nuclear transport factor 2 family protein [Rhodopila sp.]|uniref:nuclear transport factor 2 family protein n=1 Tax=Rhodopila sp. TaxID=2480087 RepID=UPI003D121DCA